MPSIPGLRSQKHLARAIGGGYGLVSRSIASLLGMGLVILLGSCTEVVTRVIPPQTTDALQAQTIVGVTTNDGQEVSFDAEPEAIVRIPEADETAIFIEASVNGTPYEIEVNDVQRIWVTRQQLSQGGRIALLTVGIVGLIALLADDDDDTDSTTTTSCPFVYSWNGREFVMDAEPYGGATTRGLAREDYSELESLVAEDGAYRILVRNELEETQYTDLMELMVVDHAPASRPVVDEWGEFHSIADPQAPIAARDHLGNDLRPWLTEKDRKIWEAPPVADSKGNLRREIVMTFPKPRDATDAKLVANIATGTWGASMIRAMLELRGRELGQWYALVDGVPIVPELVREWNLREELYALQVHIEEPGGWMLAGVLPGSGPYAVEDRVVPLDVSRVAGEEVRVRIHPPVGFWALDWFAIDYSEDSPASVDTIPIGTAEDNNGSDIADHLLSVDELYHEMPNVGDEFFLTVPAPPRRAGLERTVFLHSRGYYRLHLESDGEPDYALLREIEIVPDRAARFAAERFADAQQRLAARSPSLTPGMPRQ